MTYTRCRTDTINSPDDGHIAVRNMYRIEINIHEKILYVKLVIYKDYNRYFSQEMKGEYQAYEAKELTIQPWRISSMWKRLVSLVCVPWSRLICWQRCFIDSAACSDNKRLPCNTMCLNTSPPPLHVTCCIIEPSSADHRLLLHYDQLSAKKIENIDC